MTANSILLCHYAIFRHAGPVQVGRIAHIVPVATTDVIQTFSCLVPGSLYPGAPSPVESLSPDVILHPIDLGSAPFWNMYNNSTVHICPHCLYYTAAFVSPDNI